MKVNWTQENIDKLIQLKDNHLSAKEIANIFETSINSIYSACCRYKINQYKRIGWEFRNWEFLYNEYIIKQKKPLEIAKETGVGINTIKNWLNFFKIKIRNCKEARRIGKINIGEIFGNWEVISEAKSNKSGIRVLCRCKCENKTEAEISLVALKHGNTKNCGCSITRNGKTHKVNRNIPYIMFYSMKHGAMKRNLEFNINQEQIWDLFLKQDKKCAISGLELIINRNVRNCKYSTASLDRIDSDRGYVIDNIQWVHKRINKLKSDFTEEEFFYWIDKIYQEKHKT